MTPDPLPCLRHPARREQGVIHNLSLYFCRPFCSIMRADTRKGGRTSMSVDPIFWLLAAIGFVVLEAMTLNLVSIWFAVGSAAALLSCLVTGVLPGAGGGVHRRQHPLPAGPQAPVQPGCASRPRQRTATAPLAGRPSRSPPSPLRPPAVSGWTAWTGTPAAPPPAIPSPRARAAGWPRSTAPCSSWSLS